MKQIISLSGASFRYLGRNSFALDKFDLSLNPGEVVALMGPNGAGKTSACRLARGVIPHFYPGEIGGDVSFFGKSLDEITFNEISASLGYVSQNPFTQITGATSTVREEIAFGLENLGLDRPQVAERVEEALEIHGLWPIANASPAKLSGGQIQRVAIAASMAMKPKAIILDEPTSQLDPRATDAVFQAIRVLREQGTAVLIAEHKTEQLLEIADRILIMDEGKVVGEGAPQNLFLEKDRSFPGIHIPQSVQVYREIAERAPSLRPVSVSRSDIENSLRAIIELTHRKTQQEGAVAPEDSLPERTPEDKTKQMVSVNVEDIEYSYPNAREKALDGITFSVPAGTTLCLVGQNGAGKSTLAKALVGFIKPINGSITIGGNDTRELSVAAISQTVGFVFQNPDDQIFRSSVAKEVAFGPENLGFSKTETEKAVAHALELVGLNDQADNNPRDLSYADRKMVCVASILAMQTPVIVLDEPTAGQDSQGIETLKKIIEDLRKQGKTVLTVTHHMEFALDVSDRLIAMSRGKILADAPPLEVMSNAEVMHRASLVPPALIQFARALDLPGLYATSEALLNEIAR